MARPSHVHAKRSASHDSDEETEGTTSGRGIWSGSISFGLLQIPVTVLAAERRDEEIHFRQLDKKDLAPIRYERVSSATGKPVAWKDIVKGYEYERDNYVVLDPAELKKASAEKTQSLDIQDFVPLDQIDPAFFDTPYYLVPQKRATKAYVLLREALRKKKAIAIATFVLRTREHLCALMPVGNAIMLEVLRFGHELRGAKDVTLPTGKGASIGDKEIAMAEQLIEGMMSDWDPTKYRDRYHADVMKMIAEKAKTGAIEIKKPKSKGEVATDVVDLLDLLKKSVAAHGRGDAANDDGNDGKKRASGPRPARATPSKSAPKKTARHAAKKHEAA